jgi:hypothetical protein
MFLATRSSSGRAVSRKLCSTREREAESLGITRLGAAVRGRLGYQEFGARLAIWGARARQGLRGFWIHLKRRGRLKESKDLVARKGTAI